MAIFFCWFRIRARNVSGELSSLKNATTYFGALGGMVVPAEFFTVKYWNHYTKMLVPIERLKH
jgi:Na+/H+ antiporter NhaA